MERQAATEAKAVAVNYGLHVSEAMAWLEVFAGLFGEHLPHKDQIRLPMFDKRTVWQTYEFDMRGEGKRSIAYATFVKAWSEKMTSIKTQRRAENFGKCSLCAKFSASLSQVQCAQSYV